MNGLDKDADEIRRNFRLCGSIVFWGGLMVRPGDQLFTLKRVSVSGPNSLLLTLTETDGDEREVEIWRPTDLKVDKEGILRIQGAARLRLDDVRREARATDKGPALELS